MCVKSRYVRRVRHGFYEREARDAVERVPAENRSEYMGCPVNGERRDDACSSNSGDPARAVSRELRIEVRSRDLAREKGIERDGRKSFRRVKLQECREEKKTDDVTIARSFSSCGSITEASDDGNERQERNEIFVEEN